MKPTIQSFERFQDHLFKSLQVTQTTYEQVEFVDCTFILSLMTDISFSQCRFKECRFDQCDMSLCAFPHSTFDGCVFRDTKLVGIDWTQAAWTGLKLQEPLRFDACVLSHSTFIGMKIADLKMTDCISTDVDFREADLTGIDFSGTDLSQSLFHHTNLEGADFRRARNYTIQPEVNRLTKAKFSMPEALSLLYSMDIVLDSEDDEFSETLTMRA